jgi:hypothetical protein
LAGQTARRAYKAGSHPHVAPAGIEGEGEMTDDNPNEAYEVVPDKSGPLPPQAVDVAFLVTASELRDRKTKRRRKQDDLPGRPEAIRRLVELGLKAKAK